MHIDGTRAAGVRDLGPAPRRHEEGCSRLGVDRDGIHGLAMAVRPLLVGVVRS